MSFLRDSLGTLAAAVRRDASRVVMAAAFAAGALLDGPGVAAEGVSDGSTAASNALTARVDGPPAPPAPPEGAVDRAAPQIELRVDPRIELLAAVQVAAGYGARTGLITRCDFPYATMMKRWFGAWREHDAVRRFDAMSRRGFSFDAPVATILHYGPPPELAPIAEVPEDLVRRAGGRAALDGFIDALRAFGEEAMLAEFLAEQAAAQDRFLAATRPRLASLDPAVLERYFGERRDGYVIILAPLFHPGGFGPSLRSREGGESIHAVVGPTGVVEGEPDFGDVERFRYLVWHEFAHSFANPLIDAHAERLDACSALFEPMREAMRRQAYGTWRTCLYEHLVRAVTVRLAFRELGEEAGRRARAEEIGRGFDLLPAILEELEAWEAGRREGESLGDAMPRIVARIEALARAR